MNVPVHLSGAVAVDGANVIRISRGAMERMDNRARRSSAMPQGSDMWSRDTTLLQARERCWDSTRTCWAGG
jgi:hypothetical protein